MYDYGRERHRVLRSAQLLGVLCACSRRALAVALQPGRVSLAFFAVPRASKASSGQILYARMDASDCMSRRCQSDDRLAATSKSVGRRRATDYPFGCQALVSKGAACPVSSSIDYIPLYLSDLLIFALALLKVDSSYMRWNAWGR